MRKLSAAGIIAAGTVGLSLQAGAATAVYTITNGVFSDSEMACTQITALFASTDCTYGRNRPQPAVPPNPPSWIGYLFQAGHYAIGSAGDSLSHTPTAGKEIPALSGTFVPADPDGKIAAPITGTLSINDNGTPANPADDKISSTFSIGPMVRNSLTGQFTRAVQGWTSMDHQMAEITVSSAVANADGGVDYVIGSRGFPAPECSSVNPLDCWPTQNALEDFNATRFWTDILPGNVGIERSGLLGDPNFVLVQPPPNPPTGNLGATSTATFTGETCVHNNPAQDDCLVSPIVWGAGEDAGFDNIVMKVSTDSTGAITSALAYYTQEYRIAYGAVGEPGYDNSVDAGTFSFTAPAPISGPNANNFAASVLQGSSNNTLNTAANCVNFPGAVTVSIVTGPTLGTATVNGDETINYNSTGATGTDTIVYQCTSGAATSQGTITITVAADTSPVAPDGSISISTQGAAPGPGTAGSVNVSTLPGYSAGNSPSLISITTPPDPASGTATATGTTITFTPTASPPFYTGTATIGYTLTDNDGDSDTGMITVTIPNVTPVLANGTITTDQDTMSAPRLLAITPGNGTVATQSTILVSTAATSGTCTITGTPAAPSVTYTPDAAFFGTDSCVVTITDGDGSQGSGTFSITVTDAALKLPGGGGALDLWSLSLLGALPLWRRRRA